MNFKMYQNLKLFGYVIGIVIILFFAYSLVVVTKNKCNKTNQKTVLVGSPKICYKNLN